MSLFQPTVIVAPTVEPVTIDEATFHLNLRGVPADQLASVNSSLGRLIAAAREFCEGRLSRCFYKQTLQIGLNDWPDGYTDLPRATPLISISSVTYRFWSDGTIATLDPSMYYADANTTPGRFVWKGFSYFPVPAMLSSSEPIQIQYTAGIDPQLSPVPVFPELLKVAILMLVGDWWMNREAEFVASPAAVASAAVLYGVDTILDRFRYGY